MEQKAENAATIMINPKTTNQNPPIHDQEHGSLKKKNGSKNIFKVALFMMRGRNSKKPKTLPVDEGSRDWKKLVGSMRPLHLQSNQSPQHNNPQQLMRVTSPCENDNEEGFDSFPNSPHTRSASSSRYASAVGLNELVKDEENQNEEESVKGANGGENDGDEMIDAKAEEFIAHFYLQMRLQRLDVTDRHYEEISQRSLGF